ncbi:head GIN domain-containing protein [Maribellus sediminis]|uniref:head GIN domain-containing protein n=1 Tax=Maribellus sediminis TaxID=2696285 RepID=UPI00142FC47A|nr:head GIN domain-containing protein [Maribellus sediminis]
MKFKVLFALLSLPLLFTSCIFSPTIKGNGNVTTEERELDQFDEIKASRGINLYLTQGESKTLVIEADENLIEVIETEVVGHELIIRSTANVKNAKSFTVFVTAPKFEAIKGVAGCNIYSENEISADELELRASAGSNIKLEINAATVDAASSAGSNIKLEGLAEDFYGRASSGSNIKAEDLKTKNAEAKVNSGANIWITADKRLEANANSGGNIFYAGDPKETDFHKSSGGNVIKM